MKKRVISLVLCLLMVLSLIPTTAFAEIQSNNTSTMTFKIVNGTWNLPQGTNATLSSDKKEVTFTTYWSTRVQAYVYECSLNNSNSLEAFLNAILGSGGNPATYITPDDGYTLSGMTNQDWAVNAGGMKVNGSLSANQQMNLIRQHSHSYDTHGNDERDGFYADTVYTLTLTKSSYTVKYDLNGGKTTSTTTEFTGLTYNQTTPTIDNPTKEGYTFAGWNPSVAEKVIADAVYVAQWTEIETVDIPVKKVWDCTKNGVTAPHGDSVTVTLLQNGNDIDRTLTLTKDGNWTGTFSGLRVKDDDGVNYVYTVVDSVPGYTTTPGNADNNYTVTNTANWITPEVKSLPDLKIAKVDGKGDVITTGSATFELKKDGESTGKTITTSNGYGTFADLEEGTYTLTETVAPGGYVKSNTVWTIKVEEVSRTVEEVMENGVVTGYRTRITYGVTVTADGTTAIGPMDGAYPFTNTAISKFDIPVKKVWTGDEDFTALRPESITVRLYKVVNDESVPTGMSLTLSAANNWNGSFTGLDATDSDGNSIAYTVKEDTVPGYTSLLSGDKDGFTINNTLDTGSLKITKVLDGITASENMTFTVKIEGTVNGKAITKNVPITVEQGKTSGTVDVTLPSGDYTVTEIEPITKTVGYYEWTGVSYAYQNISVNRVNSAEADTVAKVGAAKHPVVIVTNTYEETYTDITVTKQWANVKDSDNVAQYEINVKLYANGQPTGKTLTLTKAGNWTGKFENLDIKDKDGKVITYTVVETNVPKDFTSIDGTKENNYTVTNIHDYEIEIPFTKVVKKAPGSNNPGKATFTFVAYYMDANNAPVNVGTATVETNGEGTYSGKIKVKLSAGLPDDSIELMLAEVKGAPGSWTYADTVYNVHITGVSTDKPTVTISLANKLVEKTIFTNTYSYTYTPPRPRPNPKPVPSAKTGDMGIALYALTSLLSLSGTALVIKKRKDEE